MAEYARVVTFEADDAALAALVDEIKSADEAPPGVAATRIVVLANREAGKVIVSIRFASEDDLRTGGEALEAMSPPAGGSLRRVSVESYEVVVDRAPS